MFASQFVSNFAPINSFEESFRPPLTPTHRMQIAIGRRPTIAVDSDGTIRLKEKEEEPAPKPTVIEPILMNCQELREKYTTISESLERINSEIKTIQSTEQELIEKEANCIDAIHAFTVCLEIHTNNYKTVAGLLDSQRQLKEVYSEELTTLLQDQATRLQKLLNEKDILVKNREVVISFFRDVNNTLTEDDKARIRPNICGICYDKEVNRVCVPCGHVFCDGCIPNMRGKCATCNTQYETAIILFMNTAGDTGGS